METIFGIKRLSLTLITKGCISVQKLNTPGSHIDIMPTLIDLVAPEGFKYYSFGSSMLQKNKLYGIGYNKLITKESLFYQTNDSIIITIIAVR